MKDKWHTFPQDALNSALEAFSGKNYMNISIYFDRCIEKNYF